MTAAQKIWDFMFGVALMAGAPIVTFFAVASILRFAASWPFVPMIVMGISAVAFAGACIWRKRHRVLPASFFAAEVVLAIFASILFMVVFVAAGYAAYRAD